MEQIARPSRSAPLARGSTVAALADHARDNKSGSPGERPRSVGGRGLGGGCGVHIIIIIITRAGLEGGKRTSAEHVNAPTAVTVCAGL